jgi:hypothetical protein
MPAHWIGNPSNPLSYNAFKAATGVRSVAVGDPGTQASAPYIVAEEKAVQINGRPALAVKLVRRNADGTVASFTAPQVIEDPDRPMSAGRVSGWCGTLGIDPTTLGIDDTW